MPKKRVKHTPRAEELAKHALQTLLMEAALDCLQQKDTNNGRLPHGYMTGVLKCMGHPKLNRDIVNYQISKLEEARSKVEAVGTPGSASNAIDDVSALTSPSMFSNSSDSSSRLKGGRPKQTPRTLLKHEEKKKKSAMTQATKEYARRKKQKKRLATGELSQESTERQQITRRYRYPIAY